MTYLQAFRHISMRAMFALALWSALLTAGLALAAYLSGNFTLDMVWITFGVPFLVGYLILMLFAVPIYAWLMRRGSASWPSVLIIGSAPGALVFLFPGEWRLGVTLLVFGVLVAITTHLLLVKDWREAAGSNTSLERTRER